MEDKGGKNKEKAGGSGKRYDRIPSLQSRIDPVDDPLHALKQSMRQFKNDIQELEERGQKGTPNYSAKQRLLEESPKHELPHNPNPGSTSSGDVEHANKYKGKFGKTTSFNDDNFANFPDGSNPGGH
uniref:Uncharacterized protein n=1 Tax=Meloidogyne javanica TaxID=6303 RepID=A0A915LG88_MELJA